MATATSHARLLVRRLLLALSPSGRSRCVTFVIIQLPPGDFVDAYIAQSLRHRASAIRRRRRRRCAQAYGLDQPFYVQYGKWMALISRGDFGVSIEWGRPVTEVIGDRLWLTILISIARHHRHLGARAADRHLFGGAAIFLVGDYFFTFVGFIGLAVPNFLLALMVMYLAFRFFGAQRRRAVLGRIRAGALELGQGLGPDQAPAAAGR